QSSRRKNRGQELATPVQLYPTGDLWILLGLRAALGLCGFLEPYTPTNERHDRLSNWLKGNGAIKRLDLVDGSMVRQNPLPALFSCLHHQSGHNIGKQLSHPDARVYLVYNTPILPERLPPELPSDGASEERPMPDVVETAFRGRQLAMRRDSRMEVV